MSKKLTQHRDRRMPVLSCCALTWKTAIEAAAKLADELGTLGYENGWPHTERDGYGLANRIRKIRMYNRHSKEKSR